LDQILALLYFITHRLSAKYKFATKADNRQSFIFNQPNMQLGQKFERVTAVWTVSIPTQIRWSLLLRLLPKH
jgi:hypothetical protein